MATLTPDAFLPLLGALRAAPAPHLSSSYDPEPDVLYVHFSENEATDSELTEDDVIVHYDGDEVVGLTILHASKR